MGELLLTLGRHNPRPNHLRMTTNAPSFHKLTTALFTEVDAVFGVKTSLVVVSMWRHCHPAGRVTKQFTDQCDMFPTARSTPISFSFFSDATGKRILDRDWVMGNIFRLDAIIMGPRFRVSQTPSQAAAIQQLKKSLSGGYRGSLRVFPMLTRYLPSFVLPS